MTNRLLPVALSLLALFCTACPEDERVPAGPDAALIEPPDATAVEPPDAAASGPDAGTDAGPVAPPLRKLLPAHLMGSAPIDNLVMAPNFDPYSEQWYAVSGSMNLTESWIVELPTTPVNGLPVLKLPSASTDRYVIGTARGGKGPLLASVWVGRDSGSSPELINEIAIQALATTGVSDDYYPLTVEPESERTIDRVRWVRYSGRIEADLLGFGSFVIFDQSQEVLYLLAPTMQQVPATRGLLQVKARPAIVRKAKAGEAKAVKGFWDWQRRKTPPHRVKP
ncbi:MAG: hypothetical protein QM765_38490 [Myxococcales bacterium]